MALGLNQAVNLSYGVSSFITIVGGAAACRTSSTHLKILSVGAFVFGLSMLDGTYYGRRCVPTRIQAEATKLKLPDEGRTLSFTEITKHNAKVSAGAACVVMGLMTAVHTGLCAYKKYFV